MPPMAARNPVVSALLSTPPRTRSPRRSFGEIEQIHLAAGRDATKIPHASLIRIDLLLREMAAEGVRYRLPTWLTKSIRMRIRRAATRPEVKALKIRKPRKQTPPPAPPVKRDSGWHDDGNGVLSREIETR
jgi:hypothetical protein